MPGPPKQLASISKLRGTDQPCRAPEAHLELELLSEVPDPPDWLSNGLALKCWNRRATALIGAGILAHVDIEFLGVFCNLEAKLIKLFEAGELPHASTLAQYRNYCNELGIGPASRQKFKVGSDKPKGGKFGSRKK